MMLRPQSNDHFGEGVHVAKPKLTDREGPSNHRDFDVTPHAPLGASSDTPSP
jgi:hypothetical protein